MSQNLITPNKDNEVIMTFAGVDLTLATNLVIQFGSESYSLIDDPLIVKVNSTTELALNLSATSEVGRVFVTVTYFDGASVNGTDVTSQILSNLEQIIVAVGSQLIIEDGTVVDNANSYVTDLEFNQWASIRGVSIPSTEPERDSLAVKAYDALTDNYDLKLSGSRVSINQTGLLPREGMIANGFDIENDSIPQQFKAAQMLIMSSIHEGAKTTAYQSGSESGAVTSFEIPGVIKEEYSDASSVNASDVLASFPAVTKLLRPFTITGSSGLRFGRSDVGYLP